MAGGEPPPPPPGTPGLHLYAVTTVCCGQHAHSCACFTCFFKEQGLGSVPSSTSGRGNAHVRDVAPNVLERPEFQPLPLQEACEASTAVGMQAHLCAAWKIFEPTWAFAVLFATALPCCRSQ